MVLRPLMLRRSIPTLGRTFLASQCHLVTLAEATTATRWSEPHHPCRNPQRSSSSLRSPSQEHRNLPSPRSQITSDSISEDHPPVESRRRSAREEQWQRNFRRLEEFLTQYREQQRRPLSSDSNLPTGRKKKENVPNHLPRDLQTWLERQRHLLHRKLQGHTTQILADHRQAQLEALFPSSVHSLAAQSRRQLESMDSHASYMAAVEDVTSASSDDDTRPNESIPQTITTAPSIPTSLLPRQDFWNQRFAQLRDFVLTHDGCFPYDMELDQLTNESERKLWKWCFKQRQHYKVFCDNVKTKQQREELLKQNENVQNNEESNNNTTSSIDCEEEYTSMTQDRIDLLNSIGFVWNQHHANWERNFQLLREYYQQHLDTLVPDDYVANPSLGRWVSDQRHHYKLYQRNDPRTTMTPERIRRLEELDFSWDALEARWEAKYKELKEHVQLTGSPTPTVKQDPALHAWCIYQRKCWRAKHRGDPSTLTDEREAKLTKLGFRWK